jgi:hypothetical protein
LVPTLVGTNRSTDPRLGPAELALA